MIDKDQIIKAQQEKIERIEQLQEELHKLSMLGLLTVKLLELPGDLGKILKVTHDISHTIKDVLNGMSPKEAIEKNMAENEEDE
ncbi:hypothetical protein [Streptococcus sp. HMSC070B10]|uniref:hypothetical protein n=1 Tax=Streptococcus sp. HMSC070B10 TaxID=1715092 RepID=UPI0008A568DB|nr:hypothetical protein [Streptococcus sp. HMSC070B10]OFO02572.1 hypothetical protein HMPREF2613_00690 [Streptococcus sp. HMSC070B10]